jgi:hypothetical protein
MLFHMKQIVLLAMLAVAGCSDGGGYSNGYADAVSGRGNYSAPDPGFDDRLARIMLYRSLQQPTYQMPVQQYVPPRQGFSCNTAGNWTYCN